MRFFLILICVIISLSLKAQITGPEQDCENAILVCQEIYVQNQFYAGIGQQDDIDQGSVCFTSFGEENSVWYRIEVENDGQIIFDLISQAQDDYDFVIYDVTNLECPDIFDGTGSIRCSFARNTDTTGLRPGFTDTVSTAGGSTSPNSFLAPINAQAGDEFLIMIGYFDVFTQPLPTAGYTLDFSGSTADIIDQTPAQINQIETSGTCSSTDTVFIELNSRVLCNTVAPDGSDFNITGPSTILVQQAIPLNCNPRGETTEIMLLTSSNSLELGTHTLFIQQGNDGNTLLDPCQNASPVQSINFELPDALDAIIDFSVSSSCNADTFFFRFDGLSNPVNFQWTLAGDTVMADSFSYIFPDTGTYQVQLTTFSINCSASETVSVNAINIHDADFTVPEKACIGELVNFEDATRGTPTNWQWRFRPGQFSSDQNPTYAYNQTGVFNVRLVAIDNSFSPACSDTVERNIEILDEPDIAFDSPGSVCQDEIFTLNFTGDARIEEIRWVAGNDTFSGDNAQVSLEEVGNYPIQVIVVDSFCGVYSEQQFTGVNERPVFDLGNDTTLCPDENLILTAFERATSTSWSNGETGEQITIDSLNYTISATSTLQSCSYTDSLYIAATDDGCFDILVPGAFSPNNDGLNDFFKVIPVRLASWTLRIYNRWGELIFEEENNRFGGWDGKYRGQDVEVGVYTYYVNAQTLLGSKVEETGTLTVIR